MKKVIISIIIIAAIGIIAFLASNPNNSIKSDIDKSLGDTKGMSHEEVSNGDYVKVFTEATEFPKELKNVVVKLDYDVTDFKFIEGYMDQVDAGVMYFTPTGVIGSTNQLKAGESLLIKVMLESTMPSRGMSFKDENGETKLYSFTESGLDGSVMITLEKQRGE